MTDFQRLRDIDLSVIACDEWDAYFAAMAPWLISDDSSTREQAVERLCMATFSTEPRLVPYRKPNAADDARSLAHLAWLLERITAAHAVHRDVIPAFLDRLRWHGERPPFGAALVSWLAAIEANPPVGVVAERAFGACVLVRPFADWEEAAYVLIPMLDTHSTYARACAARRLSNIANDESTGPSEQDLTALIVEKELIRPGVLGPFWGERLDYSNPQETLWLFDILERRQGPAPGDLPFNDIDFYLHELCACRPALVRRMIDHGFVKLAWLTATEIAGPVEGMEPILRELAQNEDRCIAASAAKHLANQYGPDAPRPQVSHPEGW